MYIQMYIIPSDPAEEDHSNKRLDEGASKDSFDAEEYILS